MSHDLADQAYLYDIREAILKIETYTANDKEAFMNSALVQDAVIRNFEIFGEATKRLSPEIKVTTSHIPRRRIPGLRDVLIHDYARVNLEAIWSVVEGQLPILRHTVDSFILSTPCCMLSIDPLLPNGGQP